MRCWLTLLVLLVLASVAIQYTALRAVSSRPLALLCSVVHAVSSSLRDAVASYQGCSSTSNTTSKKGLHILILATTRSGSSFVGQLFNQHPEVFYLFEPLYHLQMATLPPAAQRGSLAERGVMLGAARDLLRSLYHCRLHSLEKYIRPRPANHSTDRLFRRGASRALCVPPACEALPEEQNLVLSDENECVRRCGPLNISLAADACRAERHTAIKTVRIPQIKDLRALVEDPKLNLKVVQLVRDPRGILASRIETFRDTYRLWRLWRATGRRPHNLDLGQIHTVCEDLFHSVSTGLARPAWLRGRYFLLRYEDLARFPLQKTRELYRFLGLVLDQRVETWITTNTQGSRDPSPQQRFSTVRDSAANAENWRLKLSFDMVVGTQAACRPLLDLLGYRVLLHPGDLRNLSHSLVENRTFDPLEHLE